MVGRFTALYAADAFFALAMNLALPLEAHWTAAGPFGGNAEVIACSPQNPNFLIAGTKNSNLFVSEDGGARWEPVDFPRQYTAMLHMIVFAPSANQAKPAIYAAIAAEAGPGLFRSDDSGHSWRAVTSLEGSEVYSLAIYPKDAKIMAAGLRDGVHLSRDGGATWKLISPADNVELQPVVSVAFDPKREDTIYAGTPRLPWKTTNGGAEWSMIPEGMSTDSDIITVRVDPVKSSRVFIGACSGFWRSVNAGANWSKMAGIPFTSRRTYAFAQDPRHPEIIYAGTSRGLYATRDSGANWREVASHEIKSLAVSGDTLFVATADEGLLKSSDGGETLQPINEGFTSRTFAPLVENGDQLLTGTSAAADAGAIFSSLDGGLNWTRITDPARLGYENVIAIALTSAGTLVAATPAGVFRSADKGETWVKAGQAPEKPVIRKVAFKSGKAKHPVKAKPAQAMSAPQPNFAALRFSALCATGDAVLAATEAGLYRSKDDGLTWTLSNFTGQPVRSLQCSDSSVIARLSDTFMLSNDGGATWGPRHLPFFAQTYDLAGAGSVFIAGTSRGLFRSDDSGMTWHAAQAGLPVASITAVAIDPVTRTLAYAYEFGHVYQSNDAGRTWQHFDQDGLGGATIRSFSVTTQGAHNLLAVTSTRGIYVREIGKGETSRSSFTAVDFRKDGYVPNQQNDKSPAF
jgi:photosystem II stability/assembly factor-like uncharacterized protein